jgi:diketogulonate reductase-like aldo/keto reductase
MTISRELNLTPSQTMLKWGLQKGYYLIPKTENIDHLTENLNCTQLTDINKDTQYPQILSAFITCAAGSCAVVSICE